MHDIKQPPRELAFPGGIHNQSCCGESVMFDHATSHQMQIQEEFKPVSISPEFYMIGNYGTVISKKYGRSKIIKGTRLKSGHVFVSIMVGSQVKRILAHVLVLEAFIGPKPEGCECRHLNDIPDDNRASNLMWGTRSENMKDRVKNGKGNDGNRNGMSRLTEDQVSEIKQKAKSPKDDVVFAKKFGVTRCAIGLIRRGKRRGLAS